MTPARYVRQHLAVCRLYCQVRAAKGCATARRIVGDWERWCPAAVAGLRIKGRG